MSESELWRTVRRGGSARELQDASLVLTAVGIEHDIVHEVFDWSLRVPQDAAPEALAHLENYRLENRPQLPAPVPDQVDSGWIGLLGFFTVLWLLPSLQANGLFGWDWLAIGRMDAGLVVAGQWWRTVTALTLHADLAHLLGNSLFGAVFGLFVGRFLGSGLGWLLIVVGGALGNTLNAWLRPEDFRAIGASTATFAALAIGSGFVWRRGYFRGRGWRRAFAPVFAGIALLSFTGVGGERTDVLAHFTGFAVGLVLGISAATWNIRYLGRIGQQLCGLAALVLLAGAWMLAGSTMA
jgi:rhomboid protease GluP